MICPGTRNGRHSWTATATGSQPGQPARIVCSAPGCWIEKQTKLGPYRATTTTYARGPYRLVRMSRGGGYAIEDTTHTGKRRRYALTEPHPTTGRPVPSRFPLTVALARLDELAADDP